MSNTTQHLPPLPLKDGVFEIDNSFLEALTTCPRKLEYSRLLKRQPSADKPALSFGTAIHHALEWRYKTLKNTPPSVLDEAACLNDVLTPYFTANPAPEEDHRTLSFAFEVFQEYNKRYHVEPFQLMLDPAGKVITELSFSLPFGTFCNIPVAYTGRIDLPVIWDGQIIILDHKTTSMLGNYYFDGQKISPQYEGYAWAFEKATKQQVAGFAINAIRTKAPPAKPRTGWQTWWDEGFMRHKEYLRPGQLDEWFANTQALVNEFFFHYNNDYMPTKKKACTMYGKCAYYDVCYLDPMSRAGMLRSDEFQDNEWSPLT